jgi:hypothetical protein
MGKLVRMGCGASVLVTLCLDRRPIFGRSVYGGVTCGQVSLHRHWSVIGLHFALSIVHQKCQAGFEVESSLTRSAPPMSAIR